MNVFFSSSPVWQTTGLTLVRLITGFFLMWHGWEIFNSSTMNSYLQWDVFKNPSGKTMVYIGKVFELAGGLLLFAGLLTRIAAVVIICTMAYITFFVGHGKIWYGDQHPFLFILLALVFFFTGPGKWSLDYKVFDKQ